MKPFLLPIDINECQSNDANDCNQQCTDTIGSYLCYCDVGYALGIDYVTCEGKPVYIEIYNALLTEATHKTIKSFLI